DDQRGPLLVPVEWTAEQLAVTRFVGRRLVGEGRLDHLDLSSGHQAREMDLFGHGEFDRAASAELRRSVEIEDDAQALALLLQRPTRRRDEDRVDACESREGVADGGAQNAREADDAEAVGGLRRGGSHGKIAAPGLAHGAFPDLEVLREADVDLARAGLQN